MIKFTLSLFILVIVKMSFCQDFVGHYKDQINREVEKITKQPDVLRYQTAGLGQKSLVIYNPSEDSNPTNKREPIAADTLSFDLGKNSEVKIDCYFLPEKTTCDSVVIHCNDDKEGKRLVEHLVRDSFRKWRDMGNNEYLSLQVLGQGSIGRFDYVSTSKMFIEYSAEDNVFTKVTIVKVEIAEKEWKKLKMQKK